MSVSAVANDDCMIELDHVTRVFGDTRAVDDVSFRVHSGEVLGFIGPNGAGKTTSMKILSTLDVPTSGSARVAGFSVIDDPDCVRRRLGWMPDGFGTYRDVNCVEYLDFFARSYGLSGADRRDALRKVMTFTQLDQLALKPIGGLSKGMKQRLCLGRALIHDPCVLVLDEPAAGLDPRARIELREMIRALADEGKTILVSSHILTELAEMCDRVAIIEQGRLLAIGSVEEILAERSEASNGDEQTMAQAVRLSVTVLSDVEQALAWLKNREGITAVSRELYTLRFECSADSVAQADLLSAMIAAGIRVIRFEGKQRSLEDVFLQVTEGRVQ